MAYFQFCLYLQSFIPEQQSDKTSLKRAVFFDRDGTLIKSVHYLNDADHVELIDGAAQVLKELKAAGYLRIIVTNQAAIAKGLLTEEGLIEIQARLDALLLGQGASIDGWYFCPEKRVSEGFEAIDYPDRKPGPGMLLEAARDFDISLAHSWMIGDMLSDTIAGKNAGCKGSILIKTASFRPEYETHSSVDFVVDKLSSVNDIILQN